MSFFRAAAGALRSIAGAVERLDTKQQSHGIWCEFSKTWAPSGPDARIIPIRISDEVIDAMNSEKGWEHPSSAIHLTHFEDGTSSFLFQKADEVDHLSNRVVQQMMGAALDLSEALDATNCELSLEAIEALAEFKRAARQRLRAQSP